jgi:predicted Zn-ribbon and HTH transcriptional regulator
MADIVRRHRAELEDQITLHPEQRRVLSAIALCRTATLGGHVEACRSCGYEKPAYNSCRNRHCPKCQALAQERWIAARSERTLPVRHFHVVFTVPSELRPLARFRPKAIFDALFQAASQTLLELGRSRLGAQLGITMVLHTWTRELHFHPHVHAIVTAGGLSSDGHRWVDSSRRYLFPVEAMGELLRGKMLDALRAMNQRNAFAGFDEFLDPMAFDLLLERLAHHKKWGVYAKRPFRRADHVLLYLGRYTHRVGIANSRLVAVTDKHVTFRTKNGSTATVAPVEFLRRFVEHVLPHRFVKIRHYGLYAGSHAQGRLDTARRILEAQGHALVTTAVTATSPSSSLAVLLDLYLMGALDCPHCGGRLVITLIAPARGPPAIVG